MWEHKPNMRNTVQRDSQKAFQYAHRHYLPWIYCSNIHCTMVLGQKCGIFTFNIITGAGLEIATILVAYAPEM